MNFVFGIASPLAYFVVFGLLILCGMGNPLPEDTILIAAGYLSYNDVIHIYAVLPLCYIGIIAGDVMLYHFGKKYGQKLIEHPKFLRMIPIQRVDRVRKGFQKHGHWMIFFARFLVGFRSPTFLLSGVMHFKFREFLFFDCLGALVSVPLFVGLGFLFGSHIDSLRADIYKIQSWLVAGAVLAIAIFLLVWWRRSKKEDEVVEPDFLLIDKEKK